MSAREPTGAAHEREHRRWRTQMADLFDGKVLRLMLPVAVGALAGTVALPPETSTEAGTAPVWVSSDPLPPMVIGTCQQLAASGATSYTATGLPAGLTLSGTGQLCASSIGTFGPFTVTATNAFGSATRNLSVVVTAVPTFPPVWDITTSIDPMVVGQFFCQAIQASGATSYAVASGTIPAGLCFDTSGLLTRCPTTAGTYTFRINATNADGTTLSPLFTATVTNGVPAWTTTSLGTVTRTVPFSLQLVSTDTTSYTILSGSLPAGLTMTAGGLISGTPTAAVAYGPVVIRAVGTGGNTPQSFSGTVANPAGPTWVTISPMDNTAIGQFYCEAFEATGVGTVTYSLASGSGPIPTGLCLDASGMMVFCPTVANTFNFTVRATDDNGSTNRAFQITVDNPAALPPAWSTPPTAPLWVSGDSTSDGYPPPPASFGYYVDLGDPAWSSARGGAYLAQPDGMATITYAGWGDATLGGLIPDYVKANVAIYGNPTMLIIMGGTNDYVYAQAHGELTGLADRMEAAMSNFDTYLDDHGIDRWWVTSPPIGDQAHSVISAVAQAAMNVERVAFNNALLAAHPVTSIDTRTSLGNADGTWKSAYDLGDGIHPNANGRLVIALLVQAQL